MITYTHLLKVCETKWNSEPDIPMPQPFCLYNLVFKERMKSIVNMCDPYSNGEYSLFNTISPFLKVVVDVGAREDTYFIEKTNSLTSLYLFEPHPDFFLVLKNAIEEKKLRARNPNIYLFNMGLSDTEKSLEYYERAQSFVNRWNDPVSKVLPVVRLDSIEGLKNSKEISFLKIDTEGFELDVLRGAEGILHKTKLVQFEYGGTYPDRGILLKNVIDFLKKHRFFNFYYICSGGLLPLDSDTVLEHEQYSNILASKMTF